MERCKQSQEIFTTHVQQPLTEWIVLGQRPALGQCVNVCKHYLHDLVTSLQRAVLEAGLDDIPNLKLPNSRFCVWINSGQFKHNIVRNHTAFSSSNRTHVELAGKSNRTGFKKRHSPWQRGEEVSPPQASASTFCAAACGASNARTTLTEMKLLRDDILAC